MRIKQPFGIFFFVLYFSLVLKYYVHVKRNSLHRREMELGKLENELQIKSQQYNLQIYNKLSKNT
jgi:hypothetical protein